jgi:hypothetical protein
MLSGDRLAENRKKGSKSSEEAEEWLLPETS